MFSDVANERGDEGLLDIGGIAGRDDGRCTPDRAGTDPSVRDIARTVRSALVGSDLLRSGPALWPFGHRARQRRAHNQRVAEQAARRRAQLREAFNALNRSTTTATPTDTPTDEPQTGNPSRQASAAPVARRRVADRRTQTVVIGCLIGLVAVVVAAMMWLGGPATTEDASRIPDDPTAPSTPSRSTPASSTQPPSTPDTAGQSLAPQPPIPSSGVTAIPARPGQPLDPQSVPLVDPPTTAPTRADLSTPDGAMRAWLARWCPFDYTDPFGTAERRAQPAMTEPGWATLNPDNDTPTADRARASWQTTVAARESGRCAEPTAAISPEAPSSHDSAIVIGAITRVITSDATGQAPYVEQLTEVRVVRRGPDGLWRVDLATTGG